MTGDESRHSHDPYAPPPLAALTGVVQPPAIEDEPATSATESPIPHDLADITRPELVALAERHGVPSYGTKAEIADRIRSALAGST